MSKNNAKHARFTVCCGRIELWRETDTKNATLWGSDHHQYLSCNVRILNKSGEWEEMPFSVFYFYFFYWKLSLVTLIIHQVAIILFIAPLNCPQSGGGGGGRESGLFGYSSRQEGTRWGGSDSWQLKRQIESGGGWPDNKVTGKSTLSITWIGDKLIKGSATNCNNSSRKVLTANCGTQSVIIVLYRAWRR